MIALIERIKVGGLMENNATSDPETKADKTIGHNRLQGKNTVIIEVQQLKGQVLYHQQRKQG